MRSNKKLFRISVDLIGGNVDKVLDDLNNGVNIGLESELNIILNNTSRDIKAIESINDLMQHGVQITKPQEFFDFLKKCDQGEPLVIKLMTDLESQLEYSQEDELRVVLRDYVASHINELKLFIEDCNKKVVTELEIANKKYLPPDVNNIILDYDNPIGRFVFYKSNSANPIKAEEKKSEERQTKNCTIL